MKSKIVRKNVSLSEEHLRKLSPLLEKNGYNFSAAIRRVIEFAAKFIDNFGSLEEAEKNIALKKGSKQISKFEAVLPSSLLEWMVKIQEGRLPSEEIISEIYSRYFEGKIDFNNVEELQNVINKFLLDKGWKCEFKINKRGSCYLFTVSGDCKEFRRFVFILIFLILNSIKYMRIFDVKETVSQLIVLCELSDEDGTESLIEYLGRNNVIFEQLEKNKEMILKFSNQLKLARNLVCIPQECFEEMVGDGKVPEKFLKCLSYLTDPLEYEDEEKFMQNFSRVFTQSNLFEKVEIRDDVILLWHNYENETTILRLGEWVREFLSKTTGKRYMACPYLNVIVVKKV